MRAPRRQSSLLLPLVTCLLLAVLAGAVAAGEEPAPSAPEKTDAEKPGEKPLLDEPGPPAPAPAGEPNAEEELRGEHTGPVAPPDERERVPIRERDYFIVFYWDRGISYEGRTSLGRTEREEEWARRWDEGLRLKGRIGVKFGLDGALYREGRDLEAIDNGFDIRRLFLYTTGEFFFLAPVFYKVEFGAITGELVFNEGYVWFQDVPYVGTLKFGHFDAPFSLDAMNSSRDTTFMEVASPVGAFAPGVKFGAQAAGTAADDRLTASFGWFADGQDVGWGDASESRARLTGRLTGLPIFERGPDKETERLFHIGASASYVFSGNGTIRYRSRPESFLAPFAVDTGDIDADSAYIWDVEGAYVEGPLTVQTEIFMANVKRGDSHDFWGAYAHASTFLTGETRPYDRARGVFGQLFPKGDWGAVEAAARFSHLDLSDGSVEGGRMSIFVGGLNWYVSRYVRLMANVGYAAIHGGPFDGSLVLAQARFQLVF